MRQEFVKTFEYSKYALPDRVILTSNNHQHSLSLTFNMKLVLGHPQNRTGEIEDDGRSNVGLAARAWRSKPKSSADEGHFSKSAGSAEAQS